MMNKWSSVILVLIVLMATAGCRGTGSADAVIPPVEIEDSLQADLPQAQGASDRFLLGFWTIDISPDLESIEVLPVRQASMHLNVLKFLEVWPCTDCLRVINMYFIEPDVLEVRVFLRHPVPGVPRLCVFDVRGIFITEGGYAFPESGRVIPWGDQIPKLVNADGYTSLFNPTEYPPGSPLPTELEYQHGRFATGGDLSATLNPFIAYGKSHLGSDRRGFWPDEYGHSAYFDLHIPPGEKLRFGYAVDASWMKVDGEVDSVNDFPIEANCPEAYQIDIKQWYMLQSESGLPALIQAVVYDHQGQDTIDSVELEAPDLFDGEIALDFVEESGKGFLYSGEIPNTKHAAAGLYPLLVTVTDTASDPNLGPVNAYQVFPVHVTNGWLDTWGSLWATSVTTDSQGDILVCGWCGPWGDVDLDPSPGEIGGEDAYLSKFDGDGRLLWCRPWKAHRCICQGIASDEWNNVYVTGQFVGNVDFDPGPGYDYHESNNADIFLTKYDSLGNYIWTRTWGGSGSSQYGGPGECGLDVAVDSTGSVYVCGMFTYIADFDPGPEVFELQAVAGCDAFLSNLDSDGNFIWAASWGGDEITETWADGAYGVETYPPNVVYVSGIFESVVDFDPGPEVVERDGSRYERFLVKYVDNDFQWVDAWDNSGICRLGNSMDVDTQGDVYVTGSYTGQCYDLDPGDDVFEVSGSGGYLSKFDPDGAMQWCRLFTNEMESAACFGTDVVAGESEDVTISGVYNGSVDFDPTDGFDIHASAIHSDWSFHRHSGFVCRLTRGGAFEWARTMGDNRETILLGCWAVTSDASGRVFTAGHYLTDNYYGADFDPGPLVEIRDSGEDGPSFLMMIPEDGNW